MNNRRAALWIRVSSEDQDPDVQQSLLEEWAERRGFNVVHVYRVQKSAWRGDHHPMLRELYAGASHGDFDIVMVNALDRLGREGPGPTLAAWKTLQGYGVTVASYREPFVETVGSTAGQALGELLVMIHGWIARNESELISQRTKAALAKRRKLGLPVGRKPGARDRGKRRTNGYHGNVNAARKEAK